MTNSVRNRPAHEHRGPLMSRLPVQQVNAWSRPGNRLGACGAALLLSGALAAGACSSDPPPRVSAHRARATVVAGASGVGTMQGQASVSNRGSFQYELPLDLRATPLGALSLSLRYDHNAGNGLVGTGWKLSGLPVLHSCPSQTITRHAGVCIDGLPLEEAPPPAAWQDWITDHPVLPGEYLGAAFYRPVRGKSSLGVTHFTTSCPRSDAVDECWTVFDAATQQRSWYGISNNGTSIMVNPDYVKWGDTPEELFEHHVQLVEHSFESPHEGGTPQTGDNGLYQTTPLYEVTYVKNHDLVVGPDRITFRELPGGPAREDGEDPAPTGFIQFTYADREGQVARIDPIRTPVAEHHHLLRSIVIHSRQALAGGEYPYHAYQLAYQQIKGRSLLTSAQRCGYLGALGDANIAWDSPPPGAPVDCLPKHQFDWQVPADDRFHTNAGFALPGAHELCAGPIAGDFTGDGRTDILFAQGGALPEPAQCREWYEGPDGPVCVVDLPPDDLTPLCPDGAVIQMLEGGPSGLTGPFPTSIPAASLRSRTIREGVHVNDIAVSDFNNDGTDDLVYIRADASGTDRLLIVNGSSTPMNMLPVEWEIHAPGSEEPLRVRRLWAGELTGDGVTDLVVCRASATADPADWKLAAVYPRPEDPSHLVPDYDYASLAINTEDGPVTISCDPSHHWFSDPEIVLVPRRSRDHMYLYGVTDHPDEVAEGSLASTYRIGAQGEIGYTGATPSSTYWMDYDGDGVTERTPRRLPSRGVMLDIDHDGAHDVGSRQRRRGRDRDEPVHRPRGRHPRGAHRGRHLRGDLAGHPLRGLPRSRARTPPLRHRHR